MITQLLGPSSVTEYNLMYRLFSIFSIVAITILSPYWSAYTVAYVRKDFNWIYKSMLTQIIFLFLPLLVVLFIFNQYIYTIMKFLIGYTNISKIIPSNVLFISMYFYIIISIWNNIYSFFLNGIGRTKEQLSTALLGSLINIPLAFVLVKFFNLGLIGVVIAMCISLFIFSVVGPIITFKILRDGKKTVSEHIDPCLQ